MIHHVLFSTREALGLNRAFLAIMNGYFAGYFSGQSNGKEDSFPCCEMPK